MDSSSSKQIRKLEGKLQRRREIEIACQVSETATTVYNEAMIERETQDESEEHPGAAS